MGLEGNGIKAHNGLFFEMKASMCYEIILAETCPGIRGDAKVATLQRRNNSLELQCKSCKLEYIKERLPS
jgi:hypothetical protein